MLIGIYGLHSLDSFNIDFWKSRTCQR